MELSNLTDAVYITFISQKSSLLLFQEPASEGEGEEISDSA